MQKATGFASNGSAAATSTLRPLGRRKRLLARSASSETGCIGGGYWERVEVSSAAHSLDAAGHEQTTVTQARAETTLHSSMIAAEISRRRCRRKGICDLRL